MGTWAGRGASVALEVDGRGRPSELAKVGIVAECLGGRIACAVVLGVYVMGESSDPGVGSG